VNPEEDEVDGYRMSLLEHLGELRDRVVRSGASVLICFLVAWPFVDHVFSFLVSPARPYFPEGTSFIFTRPAEKFMVDLKLALFTALFASTPVLSWQAWRFIAPGLYRKERAAVLPFAFFSTSFFLGGAAFCYWLVLPWTMQFFLGMGTEDVQPMINISDYLGFATSMLLSFGGVFELPIVLLLLSRLGIITPEWLAQYRRHAVVVIVIVAAIFTPPDVISQIAMSIPLYLLYELSILACRVWGRKREA
jgi:sec-independent protein translocase protein TatC